MSFVPCLSAKKSVQTMSDNALSYVGRLVGFMFKYWDTRFRDWFNLEPGKMSFGLSYVLCHAFLLRN